MKPIDQPELSFDSFVGRTDGGANLASSGLMDRFRSILGPNLAKHESNVAPLGFHWCLTVPAADEIELGPDGHIAHGGFLPYVTGVRRMWGGGALEIIGGIRPGDWVVRQSRIASIEEKNGRSGRLLLMNVEHEYTANDDVVVKERQDIVYRFPSPIAASAIGAAAPFERKADVMWTVDATTILLFRYSAITFNSHRIHYDEPYARQVEGYPGLVVHGPLQATLLLNIAAAAAGSTPSHFKYRSVAPLFAGGAFEVCASKDTDRTVTCWTRGGDGRLGMSAEAVW